MIFHYEEIPVNRRQLQWSSKCYEPAQEIFTCPNCRNVFKYKNNLVAHMKTDCGKKRSFKCDVCFKEFSYKQSLKTHMGLIHKILLK